MLIIPTTFESVAKLCAVKVKVKVFVQAREYNEFDEQCKDDFGLRLDLGGELLGQEEENTGAAEVGERFEEQGGKEVL